MNDRPVYLDNHSTTRVDPRVVEAMLPYFTEDYGNAASINHSFGTVASEAVEAAREQISRQLGTQTAIGIAGALFGIGELGQGIGNAVADVTLNRPKSRTAETEADRIGVELAARAGYDPRAAINLWEKMVKLGGSQPPQWLSTHPSHESRIADLREYSAKVMPLYQAAQAKREWLRRPIVRPEQRRIGFLGYGMMAKAPALVLQSLGFPVSAWVRTPKPDAEVPVFHGADQLEQFLGQTDIAVGLLPLTRETEGIFCTRTFAMMPRGAMLVRPDGFVAWRSKTPAGSPSALGAALAQLLGRTSIVS